ncbi:WS/DGAT/MGAT family O-acyltransferase [Candidatus Mycobacterium methanotrophicum]|uniref:Diacylglycerol O-acyltransferase n=1 Tax=Candidatus Mycobacterium methanotrophicum TaxID=2943498 RepID=A0ABY4QMX7_9MYCO|nr:wax ester/triacylglycerol synthase family O-acyltransferase [Candidatus Mycobacterium methanotrophicum]UQX12372.1 wax ester/triacylglycerol synthase family O-acyltransferase [Candidatus Mycobacterium methanotrophicum]
MLSFISPTDALFLYAEAVQRPINVGALGVLSRPEGAGAQDARAMVAEALTRDQVAPLWRRHPHRSLISLGQWRWCTDDDIDLDYHVRLSSLPQPAGMAELCDLVSRLHSGRLDLNRPLWQFHLIEGLPDGRYAIYVKVHHALADGVSAMRLLQQTVSTDPDRRGMPALWEVGTQPSGDDVSGGIGPWRVAQGVVKATGELAGMAPALADTVWRAVRRRGGPLTLAAPHTPLNVPISSARSFAGRSFPIDRLRLVAKHTDATLNDVVLAMCAGALRRYLLRRNALPSAPLMAMVPVSLRGDEPAGAAVPGNRIGTLTCSLGTQLADPAERLAAVQASMCDGKAALAGRSQLQVLAMSALGAAPLAIAIALGHGLGPLRPPNVMISNVPGPSGPLYWNGAHLEALYPLSVPVDGQTLNITCTSVNDQIIFGLTACRRAVPAIGTLADFLGRELDLLDAFYRIPVGIGVDRRTRRRRARATPTARG